MTYKRAMVAWCASVFVVALLGIYGLLPNWAEQVFLGSMAGIAIGVPLWALILWRRL